MDGGRGKKYKILRQFREEKSNNQHNLSININKGKDLSKNPTKIQPELQKHFKDVYKEDEAITKLMWRNS